MSRHLSRLLRMHKMQTIYAVTKKFTVTLSVYKIMKSMLASSHSAWSESMTWLMTSSWYRGHRVLSRLMFWRSYNEFAEVTKRSKVYRLWGIFPVRGCFCPVANNAFGRYCQSSSNAIREADLLQSVVEKIAFFERNSNPSKPETISGRGPMMSSLGRGTRVL